MDRTLTPSPAFPAARAHYDALQASLAQASAALRAIPDIGSGAMGLTPDSVKATPAYRQARAAYDRAHAIARDYNGFYVKAFARELRAARDAKRIASAAKLEA